MAELTDIEKQNMIDQLKEMFGTAEVEEVTETAYKFQNRQKAMKEDYEWLLGQEELNNPTLRCTKKKREGYAI